MSDPKFAFPVSQDIWASHPDFHGMTLRDWFAGQVLPSVIAAASAGQHMPDAGFDDDRPINVRMASDAYQMADAMLAARGAA